MRKYCVTRSDHSSDELIHYGVKGQKWGVRRYENEDGTLTPAGKKRYNEDYSDKQRLRDRAIYGSGGERRINKHMNEGYGIQGARSIEAARINTARKRAGTASTVGAVGGVVAGFFAPQLIKAGARAMNNAGLFPGIANTLDSFASNPTNRVLTTVGAGFVLPRLGSKIGRNATMRAHGYSPSKYNGVTGMGAADTAASIGSMANLGG